MKPPKYVPSKRVSSREFKHWQDLVIDTAVSDTTEIGTKRIFLFPHPVAAVAGLKIGHTHTDKGFTFVVRGFGVEGDKLKVTVEFVEGPK